MGVQSLWQILAPTARTVRLEALSRKKLAVDASIWIYQFIKAVRDSQGNGLHHSHIVGFFRRICKLLYFGILPIFVFDGGAPALKRETIRKRRETRAANEESTGDKAHRLLTKQLQRGGGGGGDSGGDSSHDSSHDTSHDTSGNSTKNPKTKRFIQQDEYDLPHMKRIKIDDNDERLIPEEEFKQMADSFDVVDGININDIDPNSEAFTELPLATQYTILSHLRLQSRLRMGFTKGQLESIFPDSMDFSRFQIEQVKKRNFFTQRLMNISGMGEDGGNITRRIAGDKDRKYALIRTNDGWSLSLGRGEKEEEEKEMEKEMEKEFNNTTDDVTSNDIKSVINHKSVTSDKSVNHTKPSTNDTPILIDSDSDFEDVPMNQNTNQDNEETAEEKEFHEAVIKSIYEQYGDNDEDDLKRAIAQSKQEYNELQQKENASNSSNLLGLNFSLTSEDNSKEEPVEEVEEVESEEEKEVKETETEKPKPMPAWFGTKIDEDSLKPITVEENVEEEEEENDDGLISWNEAKEMLDEEGEEVEVIDEKERDEREDEREEEIEEEIEKRDVTNENDKERTEINENELVERDYKERTEINENDKETNETNENDKERVETIENVNETIENNNQRTEKNENVNEGNENNIINNINTDNNTTNTRVDPPLDYVFVDDEDEMIDKQLAHENDDHQDLRHHIHTNHDIPVSSETFITQDQLYQERLQKQKRDSEEVTTTMINDVQELLRRFGIPFITAPMEAEAQCAELYDLGLVDGIITDDSDCFLFGGDRIYKNMFNQKQYVECYLQQEIQAKFGLNQHRLIELGLLLGSDYTDGVKGIGPVLAMEILAEFGNLVEFKLWYDKAVLRQHQDSLTSVKKTLLNRITTNKLYLSPHFPDDVVFKAYTNPEVDHSKEAFKWGVPDLDQIRSFLMYNVGWSQAQVDEVMVPLIRDMNRKARDGTQSTIGEFFPSSFTESRKELMVGKRLKSAANKLGRRQ